MKVKICGITSFADAMACAEAGADMLGFNVFRRSPRYIEPEAALAICDPLRKQLGADCPLLVGLFVNEAVGTISVVTNKVGLDAAQLSGDESDAMLAELRGIAFKSIRPANKAMALEDVQYYAPHMPQDERKPSLLLDAHHPDLYGGTGLQAEYEVALAVKELVPRLMLAGGLTADNVAERIDVIQPWGVDVASGVEDATPGDKNIDKVKAFIQAAKSDK
jgi:phosphoribosylanthranilate isomerase